GHDPDLGDPQPPGNLQHVLEELAPDAAAPGCVVDEHEVQVRWVGHQAVLAEEPVLLLRHVAVVAAELPGGDLDALDHRPVLPLVGRGAAGQGVDRRKVTLPGPADPHRTRVGTAPANRSTATSTTSATPRSRPAAPRT